MRSLLGGLPVVLGGLLLLQVGPASALTYGPCVNLIPLGGGYCDESSFWDPANWDPGQTPGPATTEILSGPGSPATLYLGSTSNGYPASPNTQAIDVQEGDYTLDGRSVSDLNDPLLRSVLNLTAPSSSSAIHIGSDFGLADAKLTLLEAEIVVPAESYADILGNNGRSSTLVVDRELPAAVPGARSLTMAGSLSLRGDNAHLEVRRNASIELAGGISIAPYAASTVTSSGIIVDGAGVINADSLSFGATSIYAQQVAGTWLQVSNGRVRTADVSVNNGPASGRIEVGTGGEFDVTSGGDLLSSGGMFTLAVRDDGLLAFGSPDDQNGALISLGENTTLDVSTGGRVKDNSTTGFGSTITLLNGLTVARLLVHDLGSVVDGVRVVVENSLAEISVFDGGLIRNSGIALNAGALDVTNARIEASSIYLYNSGAPTQAAFGAGSMLEGVDLFPSFAGGTVSFDAGAIANLSAPFDLRESTATMQGSGTLVTATNVGIGGISIHNLPPNGTSNYAYDYNSPASIALTNGACLAVGNAYNNGSYLTYPTLAIGTGGTLTIDATSAAFVGDAALRTCEAGKIVLDDGGFLQGNGTINGSGILLGNAAIEQRGGILQTGFSPGQITIDGDYVQTGGELIFEIGGIDPGVSYDVLEVLGSASFVEGVIKFVLVNGYTGDVGATLTFFTGGTPTFGAGMVIEDETGLGLDFDPATGSAQITQTVPEPEALALILSGCVGLALLGRRHEA